MVDNELDEMVCIAADGVGYGDDGKAWGGEILHLKGFEYKRYGKLMPQKMPGGDLCAKYPARMLIPMLRDYYSEDELKKLLKTEYAEYFHHGNMEIDLIFKQLEKDINVGITTSTGRVLDALSVALKINGERTYEGEGAMKLESIAYKSNKKLRINPEINNNIINTSKILKDTLDLIEFGESQEDVAYAAQRSLAEALAKLAVKLAKEKGIKYVGGTGGVFYNEAISLAVKEYVETEGFIYVQHKNTCAGDGSVSLGQAAIGALKFS
jgi:hydrogenase maturation protein HypF